MHARGPGRSRFTLAVLAVLSVTVLAVDLLGLAPLDLVRGAARGVTSPARAVGDAVFGDDDSAEVARLRERVAELEGAEAALANAEAELARLQDQLGLAPAEDVQTVAANVIGEEVANFDRTLEIDKGADAGIQVNMPVRTRAGLVGVIDSVTFTSARIRLVTDQDLNVGVRHSASGDLAIVRGQGEGQPLLIENAFEVGTEVAEGDVIVTSGLEGSTFPPDIPVGRVIEVRPAANPLEKQVVVDPYAELDRLTSVAVVLFNPSPAATTG